MPLGYPFHSLFRDVVFDPLSRRHAPPRIDIHTVRIHGAGDGANQAYKPTKATGSWIDHPESGCIGGCLSAWNAMSWRGNSRSQGWREIIAPRNGLRDGCIF
jgi:hypothetical protein